MRRAGRKKKPLTIQPIKCVVMLSSDEEHDCIAAEKKEDKQLKRIMEFADNNNLIPMKIFRRGIFGRRLRDEVFGRLVIVGVDEYGQGLSVFRQFQLICNVYRERFPFCQFAFRIDYKRIVDIFSV